MSDYIMRMTALYNFLNRFIKRRDMTIYINDLSGLLINDAAFYDMFNRYLIHRNPYCMMIKSHPQLWHKCLLMKRKAAEKAAETDAFYGMCHAGVEEYVFSVCIEDTVMATIHIGLYRKDAGKGYRRIEELSNNYFDNKEMLLKKYLNNILPIAPQQDELCDMMGIAVWQFKDLYIEKMQSDKPANHSNEYICREVYTVLHAVEFMKDNYCNNIRIKDIAEYCHCDRSYLHRHFKSRYDKSMTDYINLLRIEKAKHQLTDTNTTIGDIAESVGYDPEHFARVFGRFTGITPYEYRLENKSEED